MKTINISERNKLKENDNGSYTLECHCKPIHYLESGEWKDIKTEVKLYSGQYLNLQNKVTVGLRNDLNTYKYMGMRYNKDTQLEFSLESVKYDDVEILQNRIFREIQDPVFNNGYYEIREIGDITLIHDIGDNGVKTWFKIDKKLEKFQILLKVHLKGFKVLNDKINNEYIPDEFGRFNFGNDNETLYWINLPQGKDTNGNVINGISHRLFEHNGELYYLKELGSTELLNMEYPIYVDASTYYSMSSDGRVGLDAGDWNEWWSATAGDWAYSNESEFYTAICVLRGTPFITVNRSFLAFNTSDIPVYGTIQSAVMNIYRIKFLNNYTCFLLRGTQNDTLSVSDFWAYISGAHIQFYGSLIYQESWLNATLDSTFINHINKGGISKFALLNPLDYNANAGSTLTYPTTNYVCGIRYSEYTGTDYDPYLSVTYTVPPTKGAKSDVLIQKKDNEIILY